jgi:hypothetical protein
MTKQKPRLHVVRDMPPNPLGPLTMAEKLIRAKQFLGENHCLHPSFDKKNLRTGCLNTWRDSLKRYRP